MEEFRIILISQDSDDATTLDVRAKNIDQAKDTATAYLTMNQGHFHQAIVQTPWRSMWRQAIPAIIYHNNI